MPGFHFLFKRGSPPIPSSWQLHKLDELFSHAQLGFAHLDVEGAEEEVLRGGRHVSPPAPEPSSCIEDPTDPSLISHRYRAIMARDLPLLVIEVEVHSRPESTASVLNYIQGVG